MICRCCGLQRIRARTCKHVDVCARCHDYLYCEGKPPHNQRAAWVRKGAKAKVSA
jgi:hypothetical protein